MRINIKILSILGLMIMFLAIIPMKSMASNSENEYKFAVLLPLTGPIAFLGEPVTTGIDLAIEKINDNGGINGKKLAVVYGDTKGDSKLAVTVFRQLLLSEDIKVFMPFLTGETLAIQPIARDEDALVMSLTVHEPAANKAMNTFRLSYSFQAEALAMADYLLKRGLKSISVIYSEDAASKFQVEKTFVPKLEENGVKNIYQESFKVRQKDFRSLVARIKNQNPTDIYIAGFGSDFPNILKELKIQDLLPPNVRITGGVPMWEVSHFVKPKLLEGIIFASPPLFINNPEAKIQKIINAPASYQKRSSNFLTFYAYDNVMILADALTKTGSMDYLKIRNYLFDLKEYNGISGRMKIKENGSSSPDLVIFEWKDEMIKLAIQ
jgi:branched-chain amino acid transport system substrate-binding protein